MYNAGEGWQDHMAEVKELCEALPDMDLIVEIGAGDCEFLASLKSDAIKLAVDPCDAVVRAEELGLHYRQEYFRADRHMPDGTKGNTLVIMRHLLEHMEHPRDFIEKIVARAEQLKHDTYLYIETPCCQEALKRTRIEDWTYEHPQHFTVRSMMKMLRACGIEWSSVCTGYEGEVLKSIAKIEPRTKRGLSVDDVLRNYKEATDSIVNASLWINENIQNIALWGGAGKSAVFIHKFGLPGFATVVDSHDVKWGYCVPGTGIKMVPTSVLKDNPVDYIIATTSWRANDIAREIKRDKIPCKKLLKFENGKLTEVPLG